MIVNKLESPQSSEPCNNYAWINQHYWITKAQHYAHFKTHNLRSKKKRPRLKEHLTVLWLELRELHKFFWRSFLLILLVSLNLKFIKIRDKWPVGRTSNMKLTINSPQTNKAAGINCHHPQLWWFPIKLRPSPLLDILTTSDRIFRQHHAWLGKLRCCAQSD